MKRNNLMNGNIDYNEAWAALSELSEIVRLCLLCLQNFHSESEEELNFRSALHFREAQWKGFLKFNDFYESMSYLSLLSKPKVQLPKVLRIFRELKTYCTYTSVSQPCGCVRFVIGHDVEKFTRHFLPRVGNVNPRCL